MNILLLYKGNYGATLRGPELRYIQTARELAALGHQVNIGGRSAETKNLATAIKFVPVNQFDYLLKAFLAADLIILHGGGPWVLLLSLLAGLFGKRVILDAYVPHWIELEALAGGQGASTRFKILIKSYFNVLRGLFGALTFDGIIAANQRQLDLYRGMMAPFSLTRDFSRIKVLPFGCEPLTDFSHDSGRQLLVELSDEKISEADFVIGWLGGTYGWFDLATVLSRVSDAITQNPAIKLVFFGVNDQCQAELLALVAPQVQANIVFVPWVDFAERFTYWSGFDVSLVWGAVGAENDYASRTRNFDCLTLGLPIVQNWDDEWGPRLTESGAGCVSDAAQLAETLLELSQSPQKVENMRCAMRDLAPHFYWSRFAKQLMELNAKPKLGLMRRVCGVLAFGLMLPAAFVMLLYCALSKGLTRNV